MHIFRSVIIRLAGLEPATFASGAQHAIRDATGANKLMNTLYSVYKCMLRLSTIELRGKPHSGAMPSRWPRSPAEVAQLGERKTEDLKVPCSIHGPGKNSV